MTDTMNASDIRPLNPEEAALLGQPELAGQDMRQAPLPYGHLWLIGSGSDLHVFVNESAQLDGAYGGRLYALSYPHDQGDNGLVAGDGKQVEHVVLSQNLSGNDSLLSLDPNVFSTDMGGAAALLVHAGIIEPRGVRRRSFDVLTRYALTPLGYGLPTLPGGNAPHPLPTLSLD